MALISALPLICVTLASRTFSSLPLRAGPRPTSQVKCYSVVKPVLETGLHGNTRC